MRPMSRRGDRDGQRRPVAPRRALSQAAPSCRSAIRSRLVLKVPAKEFLSCRDRLALCIGLGNPDLALRNDRLSRFAAGGQEIIVSDAGKLLQLRPWIALATTSPLVVGGATVSASPSTIATGVLICARLVGSSACTRAGAIAKTARSGHFRQLEGFRELLRYHRELLLWPAYAVVGIGSHRTERSEIDRPSPCRHRRGEPSGGETRDTKPGQIQVGTNCRISLSRLQGRAQIIRPIPIQCRAGDGHLIDRIVAGMIHGSDDVAVARHRDPEPAHDPSGTPEPMGQEDHRPPDPIRGKGSIHRYRSNIAERSLRRTDDKRTFDGICGGRIPDRNPELVSVLRITQLAVFSEVTRCISPSSSAHTCAAERRPSRGI